MSARTRIVAALTVVLLGAVAVPASAYEPGWTTRVIKVGEDRRHTNATDVTLRPYRPFHFYGNTIRRRYYRGNPLPTPQDLSNTLRFAIRRTDG